jgi:oxygen-independent coproporphyrinogen-3 oxidase
MLDDTLAALREYFDWSATPEFTVEAGRPDTLTKEKLAVLKKHGVTRISINPQTLDDDTLKKIGRGHTAECFLNAFGMARDFGFDNINVDVIVGLPGENVDAAERTMGAIAQLSPESVTVHTLAVKRASLLREELDKNSQKQAAHGDIETMTAVARRYARDMGLAPYYMYRQKNMVGHFENVGYCKPGRECVYNVRMIGDRQTIIALGAGAATKIYEPENNRLQRVVNVKDVDGYITGIDDMIARKEKFIGRFSDDTGC